MCKSSYKYMHKSYDYFLNIVIVATKPQIVLYIGPSTSYLFLTRDTYCNYFGTVVCLFTQKHAPYLVILQPSKSFFMFYIFYVLLNILLL